MKRVLFVDVRNAIRSPMAEAWFNNLADGCGVATSCGTMPANQMDPNAVQVMREVTLEIDGRIPKCVDQRTLSQANLIVLMGKDIHPDAFAPDYIWDFRDPRNHTLEEMRLLRDQIRQKVQELTEELEMQDAGSIAATLQWQSLMEHILAR